MLGREDIGKMLQCHIDTGDPETFVVGRLVWLDAEWFLMQDVSPAGRWNGLALYLLSDLVTVEQDTPYIAKMETLLRYRNEQPSAVPPIGPEPLRDLLGHGGAAGKIVGLELLRSGYRDVIGFVDGCTDTVLSVRQVDEFGKADGKSWLSLDAITRCYLDDEESRCLEVLAGQ